MVSTLTNLEKEEQNKNENYFPLIKGSVSHKKKHASYTIHISNSKSSIKKQNEKKNDKKEMICLNRSLPKYTSFFSKKPKVNNFISFNNLQMVDELFHSQCDIPKNVPVAFFKKSNMNISTKSIKQCVIVTCKQSRRINRQNIIQSQILQSLINAKKQISSILHIFQKTQTKQIKNTDDIYKAIKAFKKAERHLVLKFNFCKILFHHLSYEVCYQHSKIEDAIHDLRFCQYYARKIQLNSYIIPCLIAQSELWFSMYQLTETLNCLKTALEFSVVLRNKQAQLRILQKIGIIYYYIGNSYMARYYNNLSQKGLERSQFQIYRKQYSKAEQLKSLQNKIFNFPVQKMNKRKYNQRYELDLSKDLIADNDKLQKKQKELITCMLKSQNQSKNGTFIKRLMQRNSEHAQIRTGPQNRSKQFVSTNYEPPLQNCTQVIKAHLSKNRIGNLNEKNTDFRKTLWILQKYKSQLQTQDYSNILNDVQTNSSIKCNELKINNIR